MRVGISNNVPLHKFNGVVNFTTYEYINLNLFISNTKCIRAIKKNFLQNFRPTIPVDFSSNFPRARPVFPTFNIPKLD